MKKMLIILVTAVFSTLALTFIPCGLKSTLPDKHCDNCGAELSYFFNLSNCTSCMDERILILAETLKAIKKQG